MNVWLLRLFMVIVTIGVCILLLYAVQWRVDNDLNVYAITRLEINDIEKQIKDLDAKIIQSDVDISEKNIQINSQNKLLDQKKNELRDAKKKANESWASILAVDVIEKELSDIEKQIIKSRDELSVILTTKSNHIKLQKELEQLLISSNQQLNVKSRFDYSHLAKKISIEISEKCKTMILNNFTSDCPDYHDLRSLDSSIQSVSGYFTKQDGIYYRLPPTMVDSWRYYDSDPIPRIFVDAPNGMAERTKIIVIESNFDTYLLPDSMKMKQNYQVLNYTKEPDQWGRNSTYSGLNKTGTIQTVDDVATRIIYHDRYVDAKCSKAIINAKLWKSLLPDTIHYMRNNCAESKTSFVTKEVIVMNLTQHDISTSQKYKDEQRLKYIKEFCIFKYQNCKE